MAAPSEHVATGTKTVRRAGKTLARQVSCDICVVGSGIAGVSAAIEAARLGRNVIIVDSLPVLGGQAVNSIIGTFCGLYANGKNGRQFTHGIADEIMTALGSVPGQLHHFQGPVTTIVYYDEIAKTVWPYADGGRLKPVIDSTFPLADAAKAHARMESGEHVGKIVLEVG